MPALKPSQTLTLPWPLACLPCSPSIARNHGRSGTQPQETASSSAPLNDGRPLARIVCSAKSAGAAWSWPSWRMAQGASVHRLPSPPLRLEVRCDAKAQAIKARPHLQRVRRNYCQGCALRSAHKNDHRPRIHQRWQGLAPVPYKR